MSLQLGKTIWKLRQGPAWAVRRCMALKVDRQLNRGSNRNDYDRDDENEPIQFFGSEASTWRAKSSRSGRADEMLWYQPYVISGSLAVFLIYFCVLREESDIDLKLSGNLYDHVHGLEEVQLTVNYKYNKENGLDNKEVIQRLAELGIDVNLLDAKIAEGK